MCAQLHQRHEGGSPEPHPSNDRGGRDIEQAGGSGVLGHQGAVSLAECRVVVRIAADCGRDWHPSVPRGWYVPESTALLTMGTFRVARVLGVSRRHALREFDGLCTRNTASLMGCLREIQMRVEDVF